VPERKVAVLRVSRAADVQTLNYYCSNLGDVFSKIGPTSPLRTFFEAGVIFYAGLRLDSINSSECSICLFLADNRPFQSKWQQFIMSIDSTNG